ncbi:MAG: hypothetical protein M3209_13485 [Acidobacteriota bacterium]|nr:hypothetical protein [Acidobacteriota bacterium]
MKIRRFFAINFFTVLAAITITFATTAANKIVVNPTNQQGFEATTLSGGTVSFVRDPAAPSGAGALQLTTTNSNDSYAGYTKETNTPLTNITELSYYTKRNSGPDFADAAFALGIDVVRNGTTSSTFLIYEPYLQQPPTSSGTKGFRFQDVDQGRLYSTQTLTCSNGTIQAAPGGFGQFYTFTQIKQICPEAVVTLFGVFIGTFNPNYDVEVDLLNFNGTIYDFEPDGTNMGTRPETKDDCKNGGYTRFTDPSFKNQGQCIKFVNQREKTTIRRN